MSFNLSCSDDAAVLGATATAGQLGIDAELWHHVDGVLGAPGRSLARKGWRGSRGRPPRERERALLASGVRKEAVLVDILLPEALAAVATRSTGSLLRVISR